MPSHLDLVNSWLEARGEKTARIEEIPIFGFIAYGEAGKAVAAGFLRRCEGQVGVFDSLVTDPEARGPIRHEAIEAIVFEILKTARALKMGRVIAFTRHLSIIERAKSHGFEQQAHTLITLTL